jgi:hypothetical protein
MKKKKTIKAKKKGASHSARGKKISRKKKSRKRQNKVLKSRRGAETVSMVASDDPLGCCYWVDATGHNRWMFTTQSSCKGIPGSTFRANKECPGGGG